MKKLIFTLALASLSAVAIRAVDLKEWTHSVADRLKVQPAAMLTDEQMKDNGISEAEVYPLEPEQLKQVTAEAGAFPTDMTWLTVNSDTANVAMYGNENKTEAEVLLLVAADNQNMMMYLRGDISMLDHVLQ